MADEVLDEVLALCVIAIQEKRTRKRTIWAKKWLLKIRTYTHTNLLNELRFYPDDFKKYLRMDESTYIRLLNIVGPLIEKQSTVMRESISPHERLTATLRFLATGRKYQDLEFSTCISPSALCKIIPETCRAIILLSCKRIYEAVKAAPPKAEEMKGERPDMPFEEISEIKEDEVNDALMNFVSKNCCYGSKAAKELDIKKIKPQNAFIYLLETFSEKRTTAYESVPYKGELVDGPENGDAPGPWETECTYKKLFKDEKRKFEVPHTSVVKPCKPCGADGMIKCSVCRGRGNTRCGQCRGGGRREGKRCLGCGGDGRTRCYGCGGGGQLTCQKCKGYGKLRVFRELTVKYKNHNDNYVLEMTDMPDELVKQVKGNVVFEQELPLVWPLHSYPVQQINENSDRMIKKHKEDYSREKFTNSVRR